MTTTVTVTGPGPGPGGPNGAFEVADRTAYGEWGVGAAFVAATGILTAMILRGGIPGVPGWANPLLLAVMPAIGLWVLKVTLADTCLLWTRFDAERGEIVQRRAYLFGRRREQRVPLPAAGRGELIVERDSEGPDSYIVALRLASGQSLRLRKYTSRRRAQRLVADVDAWLGGAAAAGAGNPRGAAA